MSDWPELVVSVLGIRHRRGHGDLKTRSLDNSSIEIDTTVVANGLEITTSRVPDGEPVHVRLSITSDHSGIGVRGTITSRWEGECRRCLELVHEAIESTVDVTFLDEKSFERHEPSADEADVYQFDGESIDVGEVVREELMLALPLAPLCSDGCVGADPERFIADDALDETDESDNEPAIDPRWAALSELTFDED